MTKLAGETLELVGDGGRIARRLGQCVGYSISYPRRDGDAILVCCSLYLGDLKGPSIRAAGYRRDRDGGISLGRISLGRISLGGNSRGCVSHGPRVAEAMASW